MNSPWDEQSMGRIVHGTNSPWDEQSMGRIGHGTNSPWDEQSMGRTVHGTNSPGRTVRGRNVRIPDETYTITRIRKCLIIPFQVRRIRLSRYVSYTAHLNTGEIIEL